MCESVPNDSSTPPPQPHPPKKGGGGGVDADAAKKEERMFKQIRLGEKVVSKSVQAVSLFLMQRLSSSDLRCVLRSCAEMCVYKSVKIWCRSVWKMDLSTAGLFLLTMKWGAQHGLSTLTQKQWTYGPKRDQSKPKRT